MRAGFVLVTFTVIFWMGLSSLSAEDVQQDSAPAQPQTGEEKSESKITLDLKGVEINELFKMLSEKSGMTVITTPEVKGRVTVFMDNLSFTDALDVITTMQDLAYEIKGKIVKVMTGAEYEKANGKKFWERKETKTIKLNYAKPANVMNVISNLKSDVGKIISDDSTGTIIIIDAPQSVRVIEDTIKQLDQPLETAVFDINYARFADLKTYINDLITPGVGQVIVDERSAKVMVTDLPQRVNRIKKLMAEFDEQSRQVLISGEIIEITLDDQLQSGISWEGIFKDAGRQKLDLVGNFAVSPALSSYGRIDLGVLTRDNFNAVMNLLNQYGTTKVLTRPRIVVVNKEEAKLLVGSRQAYVTASQSQAETTTITSESIQFIDVGVKLSVVPTIGADGYITMKIKPEVSSVTSTLTTAAGSQVPIVQTSQSETVVKVKDGSTLIITGLMKNEDTGSINGLPGLSRTPIIGPLFSSRSKENTKTELIIFITPTIITGADNSGRERKI
ncbi:MAG: secretin N-terminal domain-containing protein [Candidatus Omnitrophota bacterium]|nr:secretin N-terminal domain-containing protein [Candidatus Omnitrophota bacterium]